MEALEEAGDIVALVRLLQHDDTAVKTAAAGALKKLAFNNDANRAAIEAAKALAGGSARSSAAGESTTHPAERVRPCVLHSRIDRGRFDVLHVHHHPVAMFRF